eukprot:jgi/Ulvmu1/8867/UM049_0049.1
MSTGVLSRRTVEAVMKLLFLAKLGKRQNCTRSQGLLIIVEVDAPQKLSGLCCFHPQVALCRACSCCCCELQLPCSAMESAVEGKDFNFPEEEKKVLEFWERIDAFKQQLERTKGCKEYVFFDGPPFATGLPHYGHILAGTIKDVMTRYASQTGHHVERRFGWDCHGLPVEFEIDQKLGIKCTEDVMALGIDKYNEECRSIVMRYSQEWEKTVTRLGRWIDFKNDYKTLNPDFMESVWWVFGQLWEKGLVYQGFKVMPFSTGLSTTLSNFEAGLNYKDVADPSVMVAFPILDDPLATQLVAWTTTPWTLPSNLALCVHPDFDYVQVKDPASSAVYIVAESLLAKLPGAVPKKGKGKGKAPSGGFEKLATLKGTDLVGKKYEPLFDFFVPEYGATAWRVVADKYVTAEAGTGIVHQAPAFGEDDYRVCIANGILERGAAVPCPIDGSGRFTDPVSDFKGQYVKDADKSIMAAIKAAGRVVDNSSLTHSYPFCWRSETPLLYKAVPSWFVRVEEIRDRIVAHNDATRWVPTFVQEKRFKDWLLNARDWAVSRSRYWGTPIPIWQSADGLERVVISSVEQLEKLTGAKVSDLHRHFIDDLEIPSRSGGPPLRRIPDVFDCWFESGSMPYAQQHYPFENKEHFEANFPADFVAEGLDQTRGWFYTLMVLSTALFDRPAFKNLVCNGLVLAADGTKMSKRLKNYPDPNLLVDKYGADALRLYLVNSPVVRAEPLKFKEDGVFDVVKGVFLPWYNAYRFLCLNVVRVAAEGRPLDPAAVLAATPATNVLDRWIQAATRKLINMVREQMEAYRLYAIVPPLVRFIDSLTNIYVRYNRRRLKGRGGPNDEALALATLFDTLLKVCVTMSPLTPFLTETMYGNLRRCLPPDAPESVHFQDVPAAAPEAPGDPQIVRSVERMQAVIELGRVARERQNRPLRTPLKRLTVAHADDAFIADLNGELREYVVEELNVSELVTASPDDFSTATAQPNFDALGKRLGKAMRGVAAAIKAMTPANIAAFQEAGSVTFEGHTLSAADIIVKRESKPLGDDMDINTDGEVLVVLDLRADSALLARRTARELVNRFQKLRKKAGLEPSDAVELFYAVRAADGGGEAVVAELAEAIAKEDAYLRESLGGGVLPAAARPAGGVVLASEETAVQLPSDARVEIAVEVTRPTAAVAAAAVEADYGAAAVAGVEAFVASKELARLKEEVEEGAVAVRLDGCDVRLEVGRHLFWSAERR